MLWILSRFGTGFANEKLIRGEPARKDGPNWRQGMSYYRYEDRDDDWETRFRRACRAHQGFAWGAFLIGFVIGGIIF